MNVIDASKKTSLRDNKIKRIIKRNQKMFNEIKISKSWINKDFFFFHTKWYDERKKI
jgi:hypothetical protein